MVQIRMLEEKVRVLIFLFFALTKFLSVFRNTASLINRVKAII